MLEINGKIDQNDLIHFKRIFRGEDAVAAMPCPQDKVTKKINPHVTRFLHSDGRLTDIFHVKPIYYETPTGSWRPLSEITMWHGNTRIELIEGWDKKMSMNFLSWLLKRAEILHAQVLIPSPWHAERKVEISTQNILFTTLTAYPDPSPETTTMDGYTWRAQSGTSWSTCASASDVGINVNSDIAHNGTVCPLRAMVDSGYSRTDLSRNIYLFDTSTLGGSATITAATLTLTSDGKNVQDSANFMVLVSAAPASNTTIASADYATFGTTAYSDTITFGSWAASGSTNLFTLNATGIAALSKTGVSKLGMRSDYDLRAASVAPTTTNFGGGATYANVRMADYTGTTSDPALAVTYTTGSSAKFMPLIGALA